MWHIIKYHGKSMLCNRSMIFWTLLFPLILSTFFSLTLGNISEGFKLEPIPIAVVGSENYQSDTALQRMLSELAQGEQAYLSVQVCTQEEAKTLLKENEIKGYIEAGSPISLKLNQSGMEQSILTSIFTEYEQKKSQIERMSEEGVEASALQAAVSTSSNFIQKEAKENTNLSCVYFFALMAMTMLYGGYWSMRTTDNQMANHSAIGARNAVAPTKRGRQLLLDFLLSTLCNIAVQCILLVYLIVILHIDFGDMLGAVCMVVIAGSLAGNAIGVMVSAYGVKSFEANTGILTALTMFLCVLSGLMMVQLKYLVQEYLPLLAAVNPANMITDAFYAQYYYGMDVRFFQNIVSLLIFSAVCYVLAYARLRRKTYASI